MPPSLINPTLQWAVTYPDGRQLTNEEVGWGEISVSRQFGSEKLYILREPAAQLTAYVAGRSVQLRAPAPDTHFFRHIRARVPLGGAPGAPSQILYHAIGYICSFGRMLVEIDPRGNSIVRFEPLPHLVPLSADTPLLTWPDPISPTSPPAPSPQSAA